MSERGGRILCCSDIHGHLHAMREVLRQAGWRPAQDLLILLGDYVDRGPRPRRVVDELRVLLRCPDVIALRGNHEVMLWDYLQGTVPESHYLGNGGGTTLRDYRDDPTALRADAEFLMGLPLYHATDDYIFVHAGLRPGVPLEQQNERDLVWIRDEFVTGYTGGRTVIFGHSPTSLLLNTAGVYWGTDKIGIDTGVAYGGRLTLLELPSGETYSAPPDD